MTPRQITEVRASFALLAPRAGPVGAMFYDDLFAADPSLRRLFRGDMAQQGERLLGMIGAAAALLDRPEGLLPVLRALGERHARYGVQPVHYELVGTALLRTLRRALGDAFTPSVEAAWVAVYADVAREMQAAVHAPA